MALTFMPLFKMFSIDDTPHAAAMSVAGFRTTAAVYGMGIIHQRFGIGVVDD